MKALLECRRSRRQVCLAIVGLAGATSPSPAHAADVLSDDALMQWARDTYARGDWVYAYGHMNALFQRNPPLLQNNPALAAQVSAGLTFLVQRLEGMRQEAERLPGCQEALARAQGQPAVIRGGLTSAPPTIDFPR